MVARMASKTEPEILALADEIASRVIATNAARVDAEAAFPQASIDALRDAGLMGLISSPDVGGLGFGPGTAARVVERFAKECGSTAMVVCMHYCGTAVIEAHGPEAVRRDIAAGRHLSTLAFSEVGSRSHFWAPVSTATRDKDGVRLDAKKSWCTSANHATAYVWSSKPLAAEGPSTIWLVPRETAGVHVVGKFDGMGLRGNDSAPIVAEAAKIPESHRLGEDGAGFGVMMQNVLPMFQLLNAACSLGLMQSACERTQAHVAGTTLQHMGSALNELPTIRAYVARMRIETDMVAAFVKDTIDAMTTGRADAMLRVLEVKAAAGESAGNVLDTAMRVCGGAAFRKEVGVERLFRDSKAAGVMGPTTDVLYDFIGKAVTGMELF
jgi:alkylation response protein AidB-like acyl-CoA dehydrogenase